MIEPPRTAVVGAGVIGADVAHALAERGRDVLLLDLDRDEAALDRARASASASASIRVGARPARVQRRGPVDASGAGSAGDLLARIRFTTERLVGLHFMNPVSPSAMVEVVRGARTDAATLGRVADLLGAMGEELDDDDAPGFVINLYDAGLGDG